MEKEMRVQAGPNVAISLRVIHAMLTRAIGVSRDNIISQKSVSAGKPRQGFANYVHCLSSLLHAHHITEDEAVFPYFRKIMPEAPYDLLIADNKTMEPLVQSLDQQSEQWRSGEAVAITARGPAGRPGISDASCRHRGAGAGHLERQVGAD